MKPFLPILSFLILFDIVRADLATIENQFRAAYELHAGQKYGASVAALDANYLGALERAMQSATQGGNLEEALVFQDEIQRVKKKGPLPEKDDGVAPSLAKLRTTYREQFTKLLALRKQALVPIVIKFDAALAAHQEELTKSSNLPEALAVKTYRRSGLAERLTGEALSLTAESALPDRPFENSLGMRFVPVAITGGPSDGKLLCFSVWETRVKDFASFATATKLERENPDFPQDDSHPAVNMRWKEAMDFCEWLTVKERETGRIGPNDTYRLPTDHEWSCALGIGQHEDPEASPMAKGGKIRGYPWGDGYPPPEGAGNFNGEETKRNPSPGQPLIQGFNDGFDRTAPVGSFSANFLGLYDLAGNVWEWCQENYDPARIDLHLGRGGSWRRGAEVNVRSSNRDSGLAHRSTEYGFRVVLQAERDR